MISNDLINSQLHKPTVCVKDRGLHSQKYQYHNFWQELAIGWLDPSYT